MASSVTMAAAAASAPAALFSPLAVKDVSSKGVFCSSSKLVFVKNVKARTLCSAEKKQEQDQEKTSSSNSSSSSSSSFVETAGKVAVALALSAVVVGSSSLVAPQDALADVAGLTPCKESKGFAKREKQEIKKLESRLKLYAPESAPALALQATIEKTQRRFAFYGNGGLLCGTDGLPHLIVDGDQAHLGEFVYPGIVFLYIAGWIGWVGRDYLIQVRSTKKPTEKEIIIDVPLATRILWKGFIWPLAAVSELRNGKLLEPSSNITVSPR